MSPTQDEMSARESLLKRITDVVTKLWSGAKVNVFNVSLIVRNVINYLFVLIKCITIHSMLKLAFGRTHEADAAD